MNAQERTSAIIKKGKNAVTGDRTYVVFGVMRGGTTMVAGVMRALGLFMGDKVDPNNQESMSFNSKSPAEMCNTIENFNSEHSVWGWKNPQAADYLDHIWPSLRNPHLICVFRDSVANGRGLNRWHPIGEFQAVQDNLVNQQRNVNILGLRNCPSLLISYEKAQGNPRQFVSEFADWLGVEANFDKFDYDGFCQAASYKTLDDYYYNH